ncbi:MAG: cytochrome b/b6 domain-containing protein [Jannaschia sp.]
MPATAADPYTATQRRLHWITVALVAVQIALHDGIAQTWDAATATGDWSVTFGAGLHFAVGSAILLTMGLRWLLRQENPPAPAPAPKWSQRVSRAVHLGFYIILILLPVTGGLAWGGRSEGLGLVHEGLRAALIVLIAAHVGGVLVHSFVWKDGLIRRMWGGT